jgi:hypothetical protein
MMILISFIRITDMDKERKKFDQIDELFPRFTEQNRESLLKTAKSLEAIQAKDAALLNGRPPVSPLADTFPRDNG